MAERLIVVLDVGKTMSKLTLWKPSGEMVSRETRANQRIDARRYVSLDVAGIERWMRSVLSNFVKFGQIGSIIPVGHGAAAVIIRDGEIVIPPLDYEEPVPESDCAEYAALRAPFAETGSPPLADGLNLGTQLYRLEKLEPELFHGNATILLWPQYWAWRLSGIAACEVTSLGCHTDLWAPKAGAFSSLAVERGWAEHFPPLRRANEALGPVTAEWSAETGLPADAMIHCGLHDSNAALLAARGFAEISNNESTVLSTGTWFVAMRSPPDGVAVDPATLPEAKDCLVNVDAYGKPIPSARFMGGREIELLTGVDTRRIDIKPDQQMLIDAAPAVLASGARVLPTFAPGFGPFPDHRGRWIDMPVDEAQRRAAVSIYAAMVAAEALKLVGAKERILVEGRFAEAEVFVRTLAALRPDDAIYVSNAHNDVSYGALRLLDPSLQPQCQLERVRPLRGALGVYWERWFRDVMRTKAPA